MNEIETKKEIAMWNKAVKPDKTFFEVRNSNYKITQINRKEHIVELDQFKKIMPMLNDKDVLFISINDKIVNKNRIEDIEPTREKTEQQQREMQLIEREMKLLNNEAEAINQQFRDYEQKYFDKLMGKDRWTKLPNLYGRPAKAQVPVDEVINCKKQWEKENQDLVMRLNEISKLLKNFDEQLRNY